jgi:hypothetical protein
VAAQTSTARLNQKRDRRMEIILPERPARGAERLLSHPAADSLRRGSFMTRSAQRSAPH